MKKYIFGLVAAVALSASVSTAKAEVEVTGGVDIVSASIWRGTVCGGPSIQPGATVSAAGFSVTAWASQEIAASAMAESELDFTFAYSAGGFTAAYTNYWWTPSDGYFGKDTHMSEITLAYEFGEDFPLAISLNTIVAGAQDARGAYGLDDADDQAFSTYIDFSYPFAVGSVDCAATVGITPWTGMYTQATTGFQISTVGLNFSKNIVETEKFSLPLFVDMSFSPACKDAYLVAGMSFGF